MLENIKEQVYEANIRLKREGLITLTWWHTMKLNEEALFQQELADKHYFRKHGPGAYYGQKGL